MKNNKNSLESITHDGQHLTKLAPRQKYSGTFSGHGVLFVTAHRMNKKEINLNVFVNVLRDSCSI